MAELYDFQIDLRIFHTMQHGIIIVMHHFYDVEIS